MSLKSQPEASSEFEAGPSAELAAEGLPSVGWVPRRHREREPDLAVRAAGGSGGTAVV